MFIREELRRSFSNFFATIFSPMTLAIWAVAIVIAVVAGPFGTLGAMDPALRFLFWGIVISASILLGYIVRAVAMLLAGPDRPELFDLVAIGSMTLVFTPLVWTIGLGFDRASGVAVPPFWRVGLYVFVMTASVFLLRRILPGFEARAYGIVARKKPGPHRPEPRLLRRLSPDLRGEILRIAAQGHFVEVITERGSETLRLRMSDAIGEMEPVEGFCTHRSHWVARLAVTGVERENAHKMHLVIRNGDRVPVSRKFRPGLEDQGIV